MLSSRARDGSGGRPRGAPGMRALRVEDLGSMNDLTIYETLAESWWQAGSQLHLLARMNPARFAYFDPIVRPGRASASSTWGGGDWRRRGWCSVALRVVGMDLSRASLHVAARHTCRPGHPETVFLCGRAEALPFAEASFDVVWCTDVLEHLADLPAALAQIARVLKPGGTLLVRYDQSLLAVPSAGDRVLGISRGLGATRDPRLAFVYYCLRNSAVC